MTKAQAVTDGDIVLAAIDIGVPPERAFQALNSAEVERWWGAPGLYRMEGWRSDLRVSGRWQVGVRVPDGTLLPADGEYRLVQAPHLVTLTRRYDWDHPTLGRQVTKVTYRFDPVAEGTRVTVRQEEFGSVEAAREHAVGWERTLKLLRAYLTPSAEQHGVDARPAAA
ncbi:MAG: SRPBCC domain-containing protein [Mycobacteriaceae bacterium]|nr:SRPBCC domain-containing protein [Mycobacteriaceae bacterium]